MGYRAELMRQSKMIKAHKVAQSIMWMNALEKRMNDRPHYKQPISFYYDPLAATVLGDFIYDNLFGKKS